MGNTSFASKNNDYVTVQIAEEGAEALHIQGVGFSVNRGYGFATTVSAPPALVEWFKNQKHNKKSVVSSRVYVEAQASIRGDKVHVQVNGTGMNRPYGTAFDFNDKTVSAFVTGTLNAEAAAVKAEQEAKAVAEQMAIKAELAAQKAKTFQVTMS